MSVFDDPGHFGRLWADTYDQPGGLPDPAPAVDFLAELAGSGGRGGQTGRKKCGADSAQG
jgi:hypothetical protein